MKKILALLLAFAACLSLYACGATSSSKENDLDEEIRITIQGRASAECLLSYKDVKNVMASVTTKDDNGDGTYDVKGYVTVVDDYGDRYKAKYQAVVSVDEDGEADCESFDMATPSKE